MNLRVSCSGMRPLLSAFALLGLLGVCAPAARAQYAFVRAFGTPGSGNGQFSTPQDVVVDPLGNIYVADTNNNRVQTFTNTGIYLNQFGSAGSGPGQFAQPLGVGLNSTGTNIFVADNANSRVQAFTPAGTFVNQFGSGHLAGPVGVRTDSVGNIYVSDNLTQTVQVYNGATFAFQREFGSAQLAAPFHLALDNSGNVYVSDPGVSSVQEFANDGTFLRSFTTTTGVNPFTPEGVAINAAGQVLVTDKANNRVLVFSGTGTLLSQFGTTGPGAGQLNGPDGIALDALGNVYIADADNNRIEVFAAAVPEMSACLTLGGLALGGLVVAKRKRKPVVSSPR